MNSAPANAAKVCWVPCTGGWSNLGFGVAALLSGAILSFVGFDAGNVTESAVTGMRAFYSLLPIAGVIGAVLIMKNYDITEARVAQLKEQLVAKRAELAKPA